METYPYKKDLIRSRLLSALESTAHPLWQHVGGNVWKGMYPQKTMREVAMMYVELISGGNEYKPFPEELKHYPVNSVVEIPLGVLDCEAYNLVSDPEALIGVAYKCPKKGLPASTCMYGEGSVPAEEAEAKVERRAVKGSGFQIYKANRRFKMGDSSSVEKRPIVYAGEGYPGAHVYNLYDPKKPNQLWELFVSAKVTGLDKGDQEAEIYYDCFYLVKTGGIKKTNQKQPSGKGNEK